MVIAGTVMLIKKRLNRKIRPHTTIFVYRDRYYRYRISTFFGKSTEKTAEAFPAAGIFVWPPLCFVTEISAS
jgi:hypothetical protein